MDINEYINKERDFLHDISSPIMVAMGHIEILLSTKEEHEKILERLKICESSIEQIAKMVNSRRDHVKNVQGNKK